MFGIQMAGRCPSRSALCPMMLKIRRRMNAGGPTFLNTPGREWLSNLRNRSAQLGGHRDVLSLLLSWSFSHVVCFSTSRIARAIDSPLSLTQ